MSSSSHPSRSRPRKGGKMTMMMPMDELDFQLVEDGQMAGRVSFQVQSGNAFNQCQLESFGSLCIVHGRMILKSGRSPSSKSRTISFECALDSGEQISRRDCFHDIPEEKVPTYLSAKSLSIIKSTQFPSSCPVEAITLEALCGTFFSEDINDNHPSPKSIVLLQASVKFKGYDMIRPEVEGGTSDRWLVQEILFDYLTLFTTSVTLPRGCTRRRLGKVGSNPSTIARNSSPDVLLSTFSPPASPMNRRESDSSKVIRALLRRRWMLEIFFIILLLALWFIFYATAPPKVSSKVVSENWALAAWLRSLWALLVSAIGLIVFARWKYPSSCDDRKSIVTHTPFNGRSFFVNGWQSWSFCGSVLHGEKPPIYSMPSLFVRAFHDGGVGTALPINFGEGKVPFRVGMSENAKKNNDNKRPMSRVPRYSSPMTPGGMKKQFFSEQVSSEKVDETANKDYIASDMFTLLSDLRSQYGVVMGFLTQHHQFGCIATNMHYDRLTVHTSGDGVVIPDSAQALVLTDPLLLYVTSSLENPFATYMQLSSRANKVEMLAPLSTSPNNNNHHIGNFPSPSRENAMPQSTKTDNSSIYENTMFNRVPVGWCSWYHFYDRISESVLASNIDRMKRHQERNNLGSKRTGFQLFQIDDGFQLHWGDWKEIHPRYAASQSLQETVRRLSRAEFIGGLWLAPFAADKGANLTKINPDWILRKAATKSSAPCNSANCGKFFYGLDVTHPSYQQYMRDVLHTVTKVWGFQYLKLDFLYAAVLKDAGHSYFDRTLTKAQIMQMGMQLIKNSVGKSVYLLGCGAPIGSMIGHVNANRISADTGLTWNPTFPLPSYDRWNLPCARNAVRNTLTRLFMHRQWWVNDPDCLLLRDPLAFSEAELVGIATVKALSGGSLILSDDFDQVSSRRMRIAQKLLPPTDQAAVAVDLCYRETPELLRLVLQSNHSRRVQNWTKNTGPNSFSSSGMISRGTSDGLQDMDFNFHIAMSPSNDEFFPWDAGMSTNLYECFQLDYQQAENSVSATPERARGWSNTSEEMCESPEHDSDNDSPARNHRRVRANLFGDGNDVMSPELFGAKSKSLPTKHSPFLIAAHKHNAEMDTMTQIRTKYLDKRDLLKRWYVFTACFWTEQADVKTSEQLAATMDITLSHEQFIYDYPPFMRRNEGHHGMDGYGEERVPESELTASQANSKHIQIRVQSTRVAKHSIQKRLRKECFTKNFSNSAFYSNEHNSLNKGIWNRLFSVFHGPTPKQEVRPLKTHFVHLRDIFGAADLQEMISYTKYLYRHQLKRRERHIERSYDHIRMTLSSSDDVAQQQQSMPDQLQDSKPNDLKAHFVEPNKDLMPSLRVDSFEQIDEYSHPILSNDSHDVFDSHPSIAAEGLLDTPPIPQRKEMGRVNSTTIQRSLPPTNIPPLSAGSQNRSKSATMTPHTPHVLHLGISHVLHMFNFWEEQYSYKVVTLDDEEGGGEVAFTDIPLHSASLYSMHLSLHPLIPKYLGSNVHFTGGMEVRRAYLTDAPIEMKRALEAMCQTATPKKKSRSNLFASPTALSVSQHNQSNSHQQHAINPHWHHSSMLQASSSDSDAGNSNASLSNPHVNSFGKGNSFGEKFGASAGGVLRKHTPKVQCLRIDFEEGALKDATWGGYIWVFLPVNIHTSRHHPDLLGRLQVMGDAVSHLSTSVHATSPSGRPQAPSFANDPHLGADDIEVVEYIDEISCLTAGYVYKIPVSLPVTNEAASAKNNPSSGAVYNIPGGSSIPQKAQSAPATSTNALRLEVPPPPAPMHHVIIAWIFDIVEF